MSVGERTMISFERTTNLPIGLPLAFDLSLSIDAHLESMAGAGERAVAGVTAGIIGRGEFVTWRARHFGITWTITSEITEWDPPHRFVDEQSKGPFKAFWHEHSFTPVERGTHLHDRVRLEAPLGPLGTIAERLVLGRYMRHLIDVRNEFLVAAARDL
jgi:ligand-binding SRPBCC domain-containing protein